VKNFADKLESSSLSNELLRVLSQLALLYALDGIDKNSGEFLEVRERVKIDHFCFIERLCLWLFIIQLS